MRAITILVVFLCVWFAASPSYALATSDRVDSTTRNQISGNADDDDNTLDLNITSNAGSVTLESTLQILILLTKISSACTFHFDHVDVVYAYYCCLSFSEEQQLERRQRHQIRY